MNLPNSLTLLRIALVPVLAILLIQGLYFEALLVFTLTSITDALDGFLARQFNMQTELGAYLDPIADKAMLSTCFITLAITGNMPAWLAVLVISRDIIILLGILVLFLMSVPFQIKPSLISKITTTFQIITVLCILLSLSIEISHFFLLVHLLVWATAGLTMASGALYMLQGVQIINRHNQGERGDI